MALKKSESTRRVGLPRLTELLQATLSDTAEPHRVSHQEESASEACGAEKRGAG
jgi:hypothetical protein